MASTPTPPPIEQALAQHAERLLAGTGLTLDEALALCADERVPAPSSSAYGVTVALRAGWRAAGLAAFPAPLYLPEDEDPDL